MALMSLAMNRYTLVTISSHVWDRGVLEVNAQSHPDVVLVAVLLSSSNHLDRLNCAP